MELLDTVEMMVSEDYKERFRAEYWQNVIRFKRLETMLRQWDNGRLDFEPSVNRGLYEIQIKAMKEYITALESRAQIEGIEL